MEPQSLSEEQQRELNELMEAGVAFEELIRTKGFEMLKSYYEVMLKSFVNELMNSDKPIGEFEHKRQQLMGVKALFSKITSTLEVLENERSKAG